jgi:hypothetical protein
MVGYRETPARCINGEDSKEESARSAEYEL